MIQLDKSKLEQAKGLVTQAHVAVKAPCGTCGEMGGSLTRPCENCGGKGSTEQLRYYSLTIEGRLDYWQARALIAECALEEFKKPLEVKEDLTPKKKVEVQAYWEGFQGPRGGGYHSVHDAKDRCYECWHSSHSNSNYKGLRYEIYEDDKLVCELLPDGTWKEVQEEKVPETTPVAEDLYTAKVTWEGYNSYKAEVSVTDTNTGGSWTTLEEAETHCTDDYRRHGNNYYRLTYEVYYQGKKVSRLANGVWTRVEKGKTPEPPPVKYKAKVVYTSVDGKCTSEAWVNKGLYNEKGSDFSSLGEAKEYCRDLLSANASFSSQLVYVVYQDGKEVCQLKEGVWSDEKPPEPVNEEAEEKKIYTSYVTWLGDNGEPNRDQMHGERSSIGQAKTDCDVGLAHWKQENGKRRYLYQVYCDDTEVCWMQDGVWHDGPYQEPKPEVDWRYTPVWLTGENDWNMLCQGFKCLSEAKRNTKFRARGNSGNKKFWILRSDGKIVCRLENNNWIDC